MGAARSPSLAKHKRRWVNAGPTAWEFGGYILVGPGVYGIPFRIPSKNVLWLWLWLWLSLCGCVLLVLVPAALWL